jgi:hypothetical protein
MRTPCFVKIPPNLPCLPAGRLSQREEGYFRYYLLVGEGANKAADAPTATDPKAIKPSGIVAAVLKLKMKPPMIVKRRKVFISRFLILQPMQLRSTR